MAKKWNYADLSKLASANGGPSSFINSIAKSNFIKGFNKGYLKGLLEGLGLSAGVYGACKGGKYIYKSIKDKNVENNKEEPFKPFEVIKNNNYYKSLKKDDDNNQNCGN